MISAAALRRLYVKDDLSVAEITRRLGVSASLVQRNLDRHGIPRKARGPIPKGRLTDLYVKQGLSGGVGRGIRWRGSGDVLTLVAMSGQL